MNSYNYTLIKKYNLLTTMKILHFIFKDGEEVFFKIKKTT